jgi:hypothetical protein
VTRLLLTSGWHSITRNWNLPGIYPIAFTAHFSSALYANDWLASRTGSFNRGVRATGNHRIGVWVESMRRRRHSIPVPATNRTSVVQPTANSLYWQNYLLRIPKVLQMIPRHFKGSLTFSVAFVRPKSRGSSVSTVTEMWSGRPGFDSRQR